MRIVLCDDQPHELAILEKQVRDYLDGKKAFYSILSYDHAGRLLFDLEDAARADLYILDIDMPGTNGIQIASRLKDLYPHFILFFYTSHSEYWSDGFRVEARRYLLKSHPVAELHEALDYALDMYEKSRKDCITISHGHDTINLPIDDIVFVEHVNRQLLVHTKDQKTYTDSLGIQEFYKRIHRPTFLFIDKGIFINVEYVFSTKANSVTLFDRRIFYISRRRVKEVKETIMKYWQEV